MELYRRSAATAAVSTLSTSTTVRDHHLLQSARARAQEASVVPSCVRVVACKAVALRVGIDNGARGRREVGIVLDANDERSPSGRQERLQHPNVRAINVNAHVVDVLWDAILGKEARNVGAMHHRTHGEAAVGIIAERLPADTAGVHEHASPTFSVWLVFGHIRAKQLRHTPNVVASTSVLAQRP